MQQCEMWSGGLMALKVLVAVNSEGKRVGETHHRAKLSDEEVMTILELREYGLTYAAIAEKWDDGVRISKSHVRNICKGIYRAQIPCRIKAVVK